MTDIAQILGVNKNNPPAAAAADPPPPPPHQHLPNRAMQKMQGAMSREILHLLNSRDADMKTASLPPVVPTFTSSSGKSHVKVGNKVISTQKPARPWAWTPFTSSARTDGALFSHWVRANVEYPEYPYSRFDIHLDPVLYSDDDYRRYLVSDTWTKSETDALMDLARIFELRWAVIHDRWIASYYPERNVEDLQHRYYSVAAKMSQVRITQDAAAEVQTLVAATPTTLSPTDDPSKIAATEGLLIEAAAARALATNDGSQQPLIQNPGTGSTNKTFDLEHERERRAHLNALWNRSKEDEQEELEIRKELKQVEAQLRKLKKSGAHIIAAGALSGAGTSAATGSAGVSGAPSAASSRNPSRSVSPQTLTATIDSTSAMLDNAFHSTAPTPMAQTPYLQSGRLVPPACGGASGINKALLTRMDAVLAELKIQHSRILPTKRACDLYDTVRKDILTLLILQKNLLQKEGALQSKRLKLAKMGGSVQGMDEEALMGIVPPPPPPPPAAAITGTAATSPSSAKGGGKAKVSKAKAPPGSASGAASAKSKAKSSTAKPSSAKPSAAKPSTAKSKGDEASPSSSANPAGGQAGAGKASTKDVTAGGKQAPKKPTAKRKRKVEAASSPAPAGDAETQGASTSSTAEPPPVAPRSDEGKQGKKRAKKPPT